MQPISSNIGGTYRNMSDGWVNIDGVWRRIDSVYININGTWRAGHTSGYYGTGADGVLNTTASLTFPVDVVNESQIVKNYESITINSGHTIAVSDRCKGLILYSKGDVTINGTINMDGRAAWDIGTQPSFQGGSGSVIPNVTGGAGGAGGKGGNAAITLSGTTKTGVGGAGGAGRGGFWYGGGRGGGGGGGGAASYLRNYQHRAANGGAGGATPTTNTGNAGGASYAYGGTFMSPKDGNPGTNCAGGSGGHSKSGVSRGYAITTGAGGSSVSGGGAGGGGGASSFVEETSTKYAGNGYSGTANGGGLIVIIAKGNITINGSILSRGTAGRNGGAGYVYTANSADNASGGGGGGGGAGGGIVCLYYGGSYTNNGTVDVSGGSGGPGGAGKYNSANTRSNVTAYQGGSTGSAGSQGAVVAQQI